MQKINSPRVDYAVSGNPVVSAIGDAMNNRDAAAPDLLLLVGPDTNERWLTLTCETAARKGLVVTILGDGQKNISIDELAHYCSQHALKAETQVIVFFHGETEEGVHYLQSETNTIPALKATDLLQVLRGQQADNDGLAATDNWQGMTHFMSCESGKLRDALHADDALWNGGLVMLHASGKAVLVENAIANTLAIVEYAGNCKRNHAQPDPYALAAQIGEVTGDSVTLAGSVLTEPLLMRPPKNPEQLRAQEALSNGKSSARSSNSQGLEGAAADLQKLLAAKKDWASGNPEKIATRRTNTLLTRIHRGKIRQVRFLLDAFPRIGAEADRIVSPMYVATHIGNTAILKMLLEKRYPIDTRNEAGQTPMLISAGNGDLATTRLLISYGADALAVDESGETMLHKAVASGNLPLIEYLLEYFDLQNSQDNQGETPLHHAVRAGNVNLVKLLRNAGADIQLKNNTGADAAALASGKANERTLVAEINRRTLRQKIR